MKSAPLFLAIVATCFSPACCDASEPSADIEFFERKVRPLLVERCYECHSRAGNKQKGGLLLDSRSALVAGGDNGPAVISGKPDESLLVQAVRYEHDELQMPPDKKLLAQEIAVIEQWVRLGLPYTPEEQQRDVQGGIDIEAGRKYWAFRKLEPTALPPAQDNAWLRGRIDAFVLSKLEQMRLDHGQEASWRTLVRRAKFDLLGLPPTPEEIAALSGGDGSEAYARLIDRWLGSPQYGERWGRYWLDLARYCDVPEPWAEVKGHAHHYRDWVVGAINEDLPYDRFMRFQLAADQMPGGNPRDLAALGFIGLSPSYWKELQLPVEIIKTIVSDEYEERVHTLSSTFLALNIACARCHDHKYDPITAEDYYGIAGVFASTRQTDRAVIACEDDQKVVDAREQVAKMETELKTLRSKKSDDNQAKIASMETEIAKLKSTEGYDVPLTPAVRDASLQVVNAEGTHGSRIKYQDGPQDMALEIRGNPNRPGEIVPRRFVSVLSSGRPSRFSQGSGRLELAEKLATDSSSLLARVFVNRVWKHHFGTGIVDTPSDFGAQGERPSHPELLEDLALRFIENGWSLKWLHREIMLSATYRQASGAPPAKDAELRYYSRAKRRRLDVESWRDAMLQVSGAMDWSVGGPAIELNSSDNRRRTLYGTVKRRELTDILRLHDFPDPLTHSPARTATTTPLQQLFALNGELIMSQAAAFASRLDAEVGRDDANRVERAYELVFVRQPTADERRLGVEFLRGGDEAVWQQYLQVLLASNEFMFVD